MGVEKEDWYVAGHLLQSSGQRMIDQYQSGAVQARFNSSRFQKGVYIMLYLLLYMRYIPCCNPLLTIHRVCSCQRGPCTSPDPT